MCLIFIFIESPTFYGLAYEFSTVQWSESDAMVIEMVRKILNFVAHFFTNLDSSSKPQIYELYNLEGQQSMTLWCSLYSIMLPYRLYTLNTKNMNFGAVQYC